MATSQGDPHAAGQANITIDTGMNQRIVQRHDTNLNQEIFTTTVDKAKLVLIDATKKSELRDAWKTPFGILVALVGMLPVSTFRDFLGISKDMWLGLFLAGCIASLVFLVRSLIRRQQSLSIDEIVENLRKSDTPTAMATTQPPSAVGRTS